MISRSILRLFVTKSPYSGFFKWTIGRSNSLLCKYFAISERNTNYLKLKYPVINKLNDQDFKELIETVYKLGYPKEILIEEPKLFSIKPVTIKFRHQVLEECAIQDVSSKHILTYLSLVKQKTIKELKGCGEMLQNVNIENRLAGYMTQWPTSLTTLIHGDVNECTLYVLRLRIIQRYLELDLDLTKEEFNRAIEIYPTIKHRPLAIINETLATLKSQLMIPIPKIKNNLYLVHADPENLKKIVYNFKNIGGIDIREILRLHPKIASKSYSSLMETKKILQDYGIGDEAQTRCFEIYTLGPDTIKERLEKARTIPEFNTFWDHPRFLRMIFYKNTAMKRLNKLYENNKKCLSLNVLAGSTAMYETFEKAPGDRLGKGKDLIFFISQCLGNQYKRIDIRRKIKRHPFWINIPLVQVKYVCEKLSSEFSDNDLYENCTILLYPWSKIKEVQQSLKSKNKDKFLYSHEINYDSLTNSQKLSLILYLLEKPHYFTGNGVWSEDKHKTADYCNSIGLDGT